MSTLHFLKYNNYQNRVLKGETLTSTRSYTIAASYSGLNFNPNDDIDTVHVINDPERTEFPFDYCLVTDDNSETIKSKWFVMDHVFNRKNQWVIPLRRDVKADKYSMYYNKPFFCMKGLPADSDDILCFNAEGKEFNQILRKRIPLKQTEDQTGRYIIGFVDKTWPGGSVINIPFYRASKLSDIYLAERLVLKLHNTSLNMYPNKIQFYAQSDEGDVYKLTASLSCQSYDSTSLNSDIEVTGYAVAPGTTLAAFILVTNISVPNIGAISNFKDLFGSTSSARVTNFRNAVMAGGTVSSYADGQPLPLLSTTTPLDGKTYQILDEDKYYTFTETRQTTVIDTPLDNFRHSGALTAFYNRFISSGHVDTQNTGYAFDDDGMQFYVETYIVSTTYTLEQTINIPGTRPHLSNLPYDIFVMDDTPTNRQFATAFAAAYGGASALYDLQLFPYKPSLSENNPIVDTRTTPNVILAKWAESDSAFGTCFHNSIATYSSMADKKVGANQHMCRLISPNGASAWEFNPATIGGIPASSTGYGIRYEFTLIPFNSYLHIFPYFRGIYGGINKISTDKEGETRGLICTGPWSLPYSTNNWSTYQLQNSAYQDSFNRQIQNMTVVQDIEKKKEAANIILGSLQSGVTSAGAGFMASGGNPYATIIAGAVGTAASLGGGMYDQYLNSKLREETINYTKDQFQNSLRNIQAQPQPLAHNSTITIGNSYWPILELYEADVGTTPTPMRDYFLADLKIHGWTMGITTTFETMKNRVGNDSRYISGYLLQVDNDDDTHIANEVMKELNKGVYIDHV